VPNALAYSVIGVGDTTARKVLRDRFSGSALVPNDPLHVDESLSSLKINGMKNDTN